MPTLLQPLTFMKDGWEEKQEKELETQISAAKHHISPKGLQKGCDDAGHGWFCFQHSEISQSFAFAVIWMSCAWPDVWKGLG